MPKVLRIGPHRFFFYSADGHEPPHVYVARDRAKAKFWLEPVAFATATGFSARDLLGHPELDPFAPETTVAGVA